MTRTRQILFIQGGGAGAHDEWDDKLVESLRRELGGGYEVRYPRMPGELVFRSFAGRSVPVSLMADGVRGVGWGPG